MKHALISPDETTYSYDGTPLGQRVAEVLDASFEVAPPLFWVECADDVVADHFYYTGGEILPVPVPPVPEPQTPTEVIQGGPTIVE
jgi:hypothetical protein